MELVKLLKELQNHKVGEDFSPIILAKSLYGKFNLEDEDVLQTVRTFYNF